MREIMVRVAYLNMRLRDRPAFSSTIDSHGQLAHLASMPETITFDEGNASGFGALFYNSIADILRLSQDGAEVGNKVRSGMLTFLQDDSGQFNTRSMIFD